MTELENKMYSDEEGLAWFFLGKDEKRKSWISFINLDYLGENESGISKNNTPKSNIEMIGKNVIKTINNDLVETEFIPQGYPQYEILLNKYLGIE